jgi:hypothetical protein
MPYETTLINHGAGILRRGRGVLTGQEMIETARAVPASAIDWTRITHIVLDFEPVESFAVTALDIQTLATLAEANSGLFARVRILAVAAPQDMQWEMARKFEAYQCLPELKVHIFRSMDELMKWLPSALQPESRIPATAAPRKSIGASLESMHSSARQTVEAFMNCYLDQDAGAVRALLAERATFEGAFSGGILHGRQVIASHFLHSFRGIFSKGIVRFHQVVVKEGLVVLEWELDCPSEGGNLSVQAHTTLELDEQGLIQKIKAVWDPKALLGWKNPG